MGSIIIPSWLYEFKSPEEVNKSTAKDRNEADSLEYFDFYENPRWKPASLFQRFCRKISQLFYFLSGPNFIVPILGFF